MDGAKDIKRDLNKPIKLVKLEGRILDIDSGFGITLYVRQYGMIRLLSSCVRGTKAVLLRMMCVSSITSRSLSMVINPRFYLSNPTQRNITVHRWC